MNHITKPDKIICLFCLILGCSYCKGPLPPFSNPLLNDSNNHTGLNIKKGWKIALSNKAKAYKKIGKESLLGFETIHLPDHKTTPSDKSYILYRFNFHIYDVKQLNFLHSLSLSGRISAGYIYLNNSMIKSLGNHQTLMLPQTQVEIPQEFLRKENRLWILLYKQHYSLTGLDSIVVNRATNNEFRNFISASITGMITGAFLTAIIFNLIFYFFNFNSVQLYAGLVPFLLLIHISFYLPGESGFSNQYKYWSYLHGFDVSVIAVFLPMILFLFVSRLFSYVYSQSINSKKRWLDISCKILKFLQSQYIVKAGIGISMYLVLTQNPSIFNKNLYYINILYTIPVCVLTIFLLILAFNKRKVIVSFTVVFITILFIAIIFDSFLIYQYEYPISGYSPLAGFLFIFNYIFILVFNRFRAMRDTSRIRSILGDSNNKLRHKDELKNNYILASTRELTSPLDHISSKVINIIDQQDKNIPATVIAEMSEILDLARRLQKRYNRVEMYFGKLNSEMQNMVPVQIKELLDYFYLLAERDYGQIRLEILIQQTMEVKADRDLLLVYLLELFDNSCLYNHVPEITIKLYQRRDEMILSYHDNGLKNIKDQIAQYSGLFQKGASSASRTGIGLSLVFRIAELHGHEPEVTQNGEILMRLKPHKKIKLDDNTMQLVKHIELLYQNKMYRQACVEIAGIQKQKIRKLVFYLFPSADIIKRFLSKYNDK